MDRQEQSSPRRERDTFPNVIGAKARRKLKAQGERHRSLWFGMGMFGMVGWSVATPTLLGVVVGMWIDGRWLSRVSWTLTLLFMGMVLGCFNAWYWIRQEGDLDRKRPR